MQNEYDSQLRSSIEKQIDWDPEVTSPDISVAVRDGVATLTGFVHNYYERIAAERAAKAVYGVKGVANDIQVRIGGLRTDPEIARDIVHIMTADVTVPNDRIKVTVRDGYVTLEGEVDWNYQRTAAADCANRVGGVRSVSNEIKVKPSPSPSDVRTRIEDALKRIAQIDSRRISVSEADGKVQLYGSVRSWFEREEAERAAWAAPGVSEVIDHIQVVP